MTLSRLLNLSSTAAVPSRYCSAEKQLSGEAACRFLSRERAPSARGNLLDCRPEAPGGLLSRTDLATGKQLPVARSGSAVLAALRSIR